MTQPLQIQRFDFFALQDFIAPAVMLEEVHGMDVPEAPPPPLAVNFTEMEMEQAKRAAFDEGVAEGIQRGRDDAARLRVEADQQLTQQMRIIAERLTQAEIVFAAQVEAERTTLQALAYGIARKLAEHSLRENAGSMVEAMVAECLPHIIQEPALLIRVHESAADAVTAHFAALAQSGGYAGVVTVRADATMTDGDIRMEWQFGAVERRLQPLLEEMEALLLLPPLPEPENILQLHT
jgi:flagellar assembly protein FliH